MRYTSMAVPIPALLLLEPCRLALCARLDFGGSRWNGSTTMLPLALLLERCIPLTDSTPCDLTEAPKSSRIAPRW